MAKGIARLGLIYFSFFTASYASAATVTDLLISEIMVDPAALGDARGEWFEFYNPTTETINLRDMAIGDDAGEGHRIDTDLLMLPQHFLTLARNGGNVTNAGLVADHGYDGFNPGNPGDEILFWNDSHELPRFEYGTGFDKTGRLRESIALPAVAENYGLTLASLTYGIGDIGTPGTAGSISMTPTAVPLPASAWLFAGALLAVLKLFKLNKQLGRSSAGNQKFAEVKAVSQWEKVAA